jgi:hypothetical protein
VLPDVVAESLVAAGYRREAEMFAVEQRERLAEGDVDGAKACERTKFDLKLLASSVERAHRGLCG